MLKRAFVLFVLLVSTLAFSLSAEGKSFRVTLRSDWPEEELPSPVTVEIDSIMFRVAKEDGTKEWITKKVHLKVNSVLIDSTDVELPGDIDVDICVFYKITDQEGKTESYDQGMDLTLCKQETLLRVKGVYIHIRELPATAVKPGSWGQVKSLFK